MLGPHFGDTNFPSMGNLFTSNINFHESEKHENESFRANFKTESETIAISERALHSNRPQT